MRRLLNCVLTFFVVFGSFQLFGQQAIKKKVQQNVQQIANSKLHQVFDEVNDGDLNNEIPSKILTQKQFLKIKDQPLQTVLNDKSAYLRINLPVEGQLLEFSLFEADIFTPDFYAVTSSGNAINIKKGLHYWGIVTGQPNSLVALSFFDNEITGLIHLNGASYNINKYKDTDYHLLYKNTDLNFQPEFSCSALPVEPSESTNDISMEHALPPPPPCVRIHVEADYTLYQSNGSSIGNTTNYINGVFSQVAILYANESIEIAISYLNIWNTPSPYVAGNELNDLDAIRYGRTYGDLVHVIHTNGGGGVAYVDVLCNSNVNTGVSGVFVGYNNVPTYSWDVEVITHELGHNMGSPHTHACAWNGNNTAIDDCGPVSGNNEGCNGPLPASGTIMSYCHLVGSVGIDFNLGFGQQPGDLVRNRVANASCLTTCNPPTCADSYVNGDELDVDCGGSVCPPCASCTNGSQDNTETGVDCGGVYCNACSCANGTGVSLIIDPDNYTSETTWDFKDASGSIIASGGPYADGSPNVVEAVCLPPGCYDFTIYDSYGDGLLDGNITGFYDVIDENGIVLTDGIGNFGFSETSNFCVSSSCANIDLDIFFDGFPGQTSWDIEDANGNTVANSSSYGSMSGNSTTTESTCLPDGCYTLNFNDAFSNGMCPFQSSAVGVSTFITPGTLISPGSIVGTLSLVATPGLCGSYTLKDATGATILTGGGSFGATESNSFCLTNGTSPRIADSYPDIDKFGDKKLDNLSEIQVLPNPVLNWMTIYHTLDADADIEVQVINMLGKVVIEQTKIENKVTGMQLDVSSLKTGIYMVQVISNDVIQTKKFVKE